MSDKMKFDSGERVLVQFIGRDEPYPGRIESEDPHAKAYFVIFDGDPGTYSVDAEKIEKMPDDYAAPSPPMGINPADRRDRTNEVGHRPLRQVSAADRCGPGEYSISGQTGHESRSELPPMLIPGVTDPYLWMIDQILPELVENFQEKSSDYGETFRELGLKGQYSDMHRKMGKLKRAVWEGYELRGEEVREIFGDLLGHILIAVYLIDEKEKRS